MGLNLQYYKDNKSDDLSERIYRLLKKYSNNVSNIFNEDNSWPVFCCLNNVSKNIISWYPFDKKSSVLEIGCGSGSITKELLKKVKSVTVIEPCKKYAEATLLRTENADSLEIIVGTLNNVKIKQKYDYILLNGILGSSSLYINSDKSDVLINLLKKYLKPNGKILLTVDNKISIKNLCEIESCDYSNINSFNKEELSDLVSKCGLCCNYYYVFPNYRFPKIIMSDEAFNKEIDADYNQLYSKTTYLDRREQELYNELTKNKVISTFSNSFFVELSVKTSKSSIQFVKFNNDYRKDKYDIVTILKDDKFYKVPLNTESNKHCNNIVEIGNILNKNHILCAKIKKDDNGIYSEYVKGKNLANIIKDSYNNNDIEKVYSLFDDVVILIKNSCNEKLTDTESTIFDKYNIDCGSLNVKKYKYYKHCFVDIIPVNIIVKGDKYILIDQEWMLENAPAEYAIYRAIISLYSLGFSDSFIEKLYKRYNIDSTLFEKVENVFMSDVRNDEYKYMVSYYNNYKLYNSDIIFNYEKELEEYRSVNEHYISLKHDNDLLQKELLERDKIISQYKKSIKEQEEIINNILNSKWMKLKRIVLFWKK